jgi:uncharacterized membrane protein YfcA
MSWLIAFLFGAAAALLVGFSKTGMPGASIPAVALMAEAFRENTKLSVGALLPILIVGDLFAILYYRRHAQWRRLWELLPYVGAGMIPGFLVLWKAPEDGYQVLLGAIILTLLTLQFFPEQRRRSLVTDRWWFVAATGVLAGFGTAVGNAAGPVMSIFMVSRRLDKHQFLGTAAWFFFIVNVSKVPPFLYLEVMTPATLRFSLTLVPAVVVGAVIGAAALKRIPQLAFNTLVLVLAGVAGLRMVFF